MRTAALACALVGGAALLLGVAAPAASAQPATPSTHAAHHATVQYGRHLAAIGGTFHGNRVHRGFNQDGGNWSGYVATGSGFSSASVSWTEPSVTCNSSNDLMAPWVGLDGYGSQSVEQTGVQTDCSSGSPAYSAWYEMYPANPVYYNDPVGAGDQMNSSVTTDGNGNYTITLSDTTQGWTETTPQSYDGANASAEAIIESPTASYPNFGEVDFSNFQINGQDAGSFNPTALDASNSSGYEDHTSGLSGGAFSIAYEQE